MAVRRTFAPPPQDSSGQTAAQVLALATSRAAIPRRVRPMPPIARVTPPADEPPPGVTPRDRARKAVETAVRHVGPLDVREILHELHGPAFEAAAELDRARVLAYLVGLGADAFYELGRDLASRRDERRDLAARDERRDAAEADASQLSGSSASGVTDSASQLALSSGAPVTPLPKSPE